MKLSDLPTRFQIPFANSAGGGYVRPVPEASQIGVQDGAASLTTGFPPLNFLPVGAGGAPPFGQDMNGILRQITQWSRWQGAGGLSTYNSGFSSAVGGYPKNCVLMATSTDHLWLNLVDDNTTNPDTGGANWTPLGLAATQPEVLAGLRDDVFVSPLTLAGYGPGLAGLLATMPIYFNVENTDGHLAVISPGTGTVRVPAGKVFTQRGVLSVTTTQTDLVTSSSLTYHLRWDRSNGFTLNSLSDPAYNPTSAAETSPIFDSTFDSMLVARVITSGGNVATITNLVNRNVMSFETSRTVNVPNVTPNAASTTVTDTAITVNWGRSPQWVFVPTATGGQNVASNFDIQDTSPGVPGTRYSIMCAVQVYNPTGVTQSIDCLYYLYARA